ncbi:hypothetical protein RMN57_29405 [Kitasatospora sp. CM 4170]|uniref:Tetratricopeptide repeat protein n=1 Tax=Kitasatospora aburaviensis TaxID=67265 RepID=A0ABW1ENB0_9ACTN|nr:hypothetical protein [Kitasatospora sp. CM 4170]WNM48510.1 hypothetical protein RMN57_29405 [Kitasatospora sp. CM 4170]
MTTTPLDTARSLIEAGDPTAALRELRSAAAEVPAAQVAPLIERMAADSGFDDLAEAARTLAAEPAHPVALYQYGYACVGRGVAFLAVPALTEALRLAAPQRGGLLAGARGRADERLPILSELAVALEDEERHAEAVAVLREHDGLLRDWPERYLLAYNALMAGDAAAARAAFDRLPADAGEWQPAADRLRRSLDRAGAVVAAAQPDDPDPLHHRALRAWHFVLTGGVLATLSPYGYNAGMAGRYAFVQPGYELCRQGLERLQLITTATGTVPRSVSLLPGRADRALGLAAAELFGLPAQAYRPGVADTVVVAHSLRDLDGELLTALRERAPGEVLYEHATCWTTPPAVSADVTGLLAQVARAPWEPLGGEPDERPAQELAKDIVAADPTPIEGDGETPPDPDAGLAAFARSVGDRWLNGPRDRCRSTGPVRSSRFA